MIFNISCRVPWHDNGFNGTICKNPEKNQFCKRCKNIANEIIIDEESKYKNRYFKDVLDTELKSKPCIREGACFMYNDYLYVKAKHPYSRNYYFNNLLETEEELPPYSYPFVPFKWLNKSLDNNDKKYLIEKTKRYGINYDDNLESEIKNKVNSHPENKNKKLNYDWVNDGRNQKEIFNFLINNIKPDESLMFFYSKQVPFIEKSNRVLIAVGHALKINDIKEYDKKNDDGIDSAYLWEIMIEHSIRPNCCDDGFIFPFDEILKKQKEDLKFDINKSIVLIDDDYFQEFSYRSEVLSYDATIDTLNKMENALKYNEEQGVKFDYKSAFKWIEKEIEKVWVERGEFPGLGNLLCAYGVESGIDVAEKIKLELNNSINFYDDLNNLFKNSISKLKIADKKIKKSLENFIFNKWDNIYKNKNDLYLFDLLSRVSFEYMQIEYIVQKVENEPNLIPNITENPYILYELTMDLDDNDNRKLKLKQLDYAFCKPDNCSFEDKNIINDNIRIRGRGDKRRIKAYILDLLIKEVNNGNTVYPFKYVINKINDLRIDVPCRLTIKDLLDNRNFYEENDKCLILSSDENNDEYYFKLNKYKKIDDIISSYVNTNIEKKNNINVDWNKKYDEFILKNKYELNEDWKKEDVLALEKLANNRFSILTGGAGTGKTSILSILCNENKINNGGVLLLAPTGKASVRMNQTIGIESKTLASFLLEANLYENGHYRIATGNNKNSFKEYNTIIVDESSMLTEDMLGSLLSYIDKNIHRLILVGDYNQLPPIGAGRPFFDIIEFLKNSDKYKNNIIESFYNKRQIGKDRIDVDFANCFKYENKGAKEFLDTYLNDIRDNKCENIEFVSSDDSNFNYKIKEELVKATKIKGLTEERYMKNIDDIEGFNRSIGKVCNDSQPWFNKSRDKSDEFGCANFAENWQIISPIRGKNIGVQNINYLIHSSYKDEEFWEKNIKHIPKPSGPEKIMYGEKVIQIRNELNRYHYPTDLYSNFLANGEIGITCRYNKDTRYNNFNVEFSDKKGVIYSYYPTEIDSEDESPLELAYALTIHKCQGSQFKNVISVLKKECGMLSKELIYTALTRHEDKIFIIGDENLDFLKIYIDNTYSEVAKRFTGLFKLPDLIQYENTYYQKGLIHVGDGGIMLRSKSEVIIWNKLYALNDKFTPKYEERFADGKTLPDFIIKDKNDEIKFIWEHLGLTKDKNYMNRWEEKKQIYNRNGFSEEKGNLIITKDVNNAINSVEIDEKIKYILSNLQ